MHFTINDFEKVKDNPLLVKNNIDFYKFDNEAIITIINDAENAKEICELSGVEVNFNNAKNATALLVKIYECSNDQLELANDLTEFALAYIYAAAAKMIDEKDLEAYCLKLAAIYEMSKYIEK